MLHKKFRGFEKYRLSAENPKHDFGFTEKIFIRDENRPKNCISFM
jgi:hypothetical protein